ncbi:MAG: nitrous oxide-stimulated promoter family protein [Chloroflexi bacterium]|nr:nitrous oxide-stimulated promoter family protein [Chloroflexota bacterium]
MSSIAQKITEKKSRDIRVLTDFVGIYCREKHERVEKSVFLPSEMGIPCLQKGELALCSECTRLLKHGIVKLLMCTQDPKPMCKKCPKHCYAPGYRGRIKEVMKFSGLYLIKHGRVDLLLHYMM